MFKQGIKVIIKVKAAEITLPLLSMQADIKLLNVRNKKIEMSYELCRKDAETLSMMTEDDILQYIKTNNYIPSYFGPVGTVIGTALGVFVGAYILSEAGEDVGMYIGGLDYGPGNPIEYHLERGR